MMDLQTQLFNRELEQTGVVSLRLLPTVRQLELLLSIDSEADFWHLTALDVQDLIHHWYLCKNIYRRLENE